MQQQPYNLPGPSPMSLQQPFVMAPQQQGKEVHRRYKDIMSLHYGRNPFVQKNDINNENVYRFKFRGKDVCITLYHDVLYMEDILYMHVDGNGKTEWCDAATPILDKQCEGLQSGELKLPGVKTGENKKELVSEEEFHKCFAIPYAYGTNGPKWSHETILLYKYSSNSTTKYWQIPENTWKRVHNIPGKQHAELKMIKDLENIQDYLTIQPDDNEGSYQCILSVEVILSYSPCDKCSYALFHDKEKMDEKLRKRKEGNKDIAVLKTLSAFSLTQEVDKEEEEEKIEFKITFSNFYNHLERFPDGKNNMKGLENLMRKEIKLDIFTDNNWQYFFNAAGLVTKRQRRERDDEKILQYLEGLVTSERILAIEQDLRKNKLL
ncbi:uncharacterized protein [Mytilus edulis]|uniref:uncharacterized protein n=1 Tax=Mytilus edulis TaxID=6550 RepID=UPI0039EE2AF2